MLKVKICGVTNPDDALLITNCGADFIGFNFFKESPRKVSTAMCKDIVSKLPGFIASVGVFVDETAAEVAKAAKKCSLKYIQLHGNEDPAYIVELKTKTDAKIIKAFHMSHDTSLSDMSRYSDLVEYFLLDAYVEGIQGGTGETFNWGLANKVKELNKPFFIAGGLNPGNVAQAIDMVRPFGVDAASGVERLPRRKDYDKLKSFINNARKA